MHKSWQTVLPGVRARYLPPSRPVAKKTANPNEIRNCSVTKIP